MSDIYTPKLPCRVSAVNVNPYPGPRCITYAVVDADGYQVDEYGTRTTAEIACAALNERGAAEVES